MKRLLTALAMLFVFLLPLAAGAEDGYVSTPNISVTTAKGTASFTLKSDSEGVRIYYTTNGSDPTSSSTRYSSRVTVKETCEVRAVAYDYTEKEYSEVGYYLVTVTKERVAAPTFTAAAAVGGKKVTIKTATSGATIYYTTDGSTPTSADKRYSSAISVTEDTVIKAFAVKSGCAPSAVKTANCTVDRLSKPTAKATTLNDGKKIALTASNGAAIYYTTNGSAPTTGSKKYSSAFTLTSSATVKAMAVKSGYKNSEIAEFEVEVAKPECAEPKATKTAVLGGYTVKLTSATSGAVIYYTTDGTTPDKYSKKYTASGIKIEEEGTAYIRAVATKTGYADSDIADFEVELSRLAKPTATKEKVSNGYKIALKASSGASVYYTTNGSKPTTSSKKYTSAFTVTTDTTIKAIAVKNGCAPSETAEFEVEVKAECAEPKLTKTEAYGGYIVKITSATSGAAIYYTTDGTTPDKYSNKYTSSGVSVGKEGTTYVKAVAVRSGYADSDVGELRVTVAKLSTPKATSAAVSGGKKITLTASSGATIYYTTNGTTPTTSSKRYTSAFTVTSSCTLKAIAVKKGYASSNVISAKINVANSANTVANPTATKKDYGDYVKVTLKTATSGAKIYYTTDGTAPGSGSKYVSSGGVVTLYESSVIRAVAKKSGYEDSGIVRFIVNMSDGDVTILSLDGDDGTELFGEAEGDVFTEEELAETEVEAVDDGEASEYEEVLNFEEV